MRKFFNQLSENEGRKVPVNKRLSAKMLKEGEKYIAQGDYSSAAPFFHAAHVANPYCPIIAAHVIKGLISQEDYDGAFAFAERNRPEYPISLPFLMQYIEALYWAEGDGNCEKGLLVCETMERQETHVTSARFEMLYGCFLLGTGSAREAQACFEQAIVLEESDAVYYHFIQAVQEVGNFQQYDAYFTEKLLTERESDVPVSMRRLEAAKFYYCWYGHLQDFEPENAKRKIYRAKDLIGEADELSFVERLEKGELDEIAELCEEIDGEYSRIDTDFEPPDRDFL